MGLRSCAAAAGPASPAETELPGPSDCGDRPGGIHLADALVEGIGDVEVACPVHRHGIGAVELRLDRRTLVPAETGLPGPRDRGDRPGGIHLANPVAAGIGDVEIACPVHRHTTGGGELRLGRRTPVPAETALPGPRDRGDRPGGIHLADALVEGIGDVEVARPVHRHAMGISELRLGRRTPVPAETARAGPRDRSDRPGGIHLADAVVALIGDVEVARPVHRHAIGAVELRLDRRTLVPNRYPTDECINSIASLRLHPGRCGEQRQAADDERRGKIQEELMSTSGWMILSPGVFVFGSQKLVGSQPPSTGTKTNSFPS